MRSSGCFAAPETVSLAIIGVASCPSRAVDFNKHREFHLLLVCKTQHRAVFKTALAHRSLRPSSIPTSCHSSLSLNLLALREPLTVFFGQFFSHVCELLIFYGIISLSRCMCNLPALKPKLYQIKIKTNMAAIFCTFVPAKRVAPGRHRSNRFLI